MNETSQALPYRIALRFAISGDLRFLSHQDSMRLFERACVRADLPLRWGQGFNPRPKFSLPLPRPVGVASEDELLVLDLQSEPMQAPLKPEDVLGRLAEQVPPDVHLLDAVDLTDTPRPNWVRYRVELPPGTDWSRLAQAADSLLAADDLVIERTLDGKGNSKPLNIRPFLQDLQVRPEAYQLAMTLALLASGTARPAEVLRALGLEADKLTHRVTREQVDWQLSDSGSATSRKDA